MATEALNIYWYEDGRKPEQCKTKKIRTVQMKRAILFLFPIEFVIPYIWAFSVIEYCFYRGGVIKNISTKTNLYFHLVNKFIV